VNKDFDPQIQYFATAFIDLLGQRGKLRRITALPDGPDDPKKAEIADLIVGTIGVVRDLRNAYTEFMDGFSEVSDQVKSLASPLREQIIEARKFDVRIVGLGDAVALSVGLKSSNNFVQPTNGLLAILMGTCGITLLSLAAGRPLRGGVDVGVGGLIEENEVYGASMLRAVELESKKAISPRIALGGELNKYLKAMVDMPIRNKADEIANAYGREASKLLFVDLDGQLCLDFMGPFVKSQLGQSIDSDEIVKIVDWTNGELDLVRGRGDQKLIPRYEALKAYVDSRSAHWLSSDQ
jgi:hypothetical protein